MKYDLIIVGGGPAGLTAAIYAARYKLNTLVFSKNIGGLAATAHKVCNYPSYIDIKGFELMQKFINQVKEFGVEIKYEEINKINGKDNDFFIKTKKADYNAKKIIFAGGTTKLKLNVKGEGDFLGKGVSYCATCDAALFKDKKTIVVGGSDAALTAALLLSEYAKEIYIIYRKDKFFRGDPSWVDLVKKNKKIKCMFNEEILEIIGDNLVKKVKLKSEKNIDIDGVFIEIGSIPESKIIDDLNVKKNKKEYIIADKNQKTNVKGFYAAGDVTNNSLKQIITAAGEGAVASFQVYDEIRKDK